MRFGILQVKAAMVKVLYNFKMVRGPKSPEVMEVDPTSMVAGPKKGFWVKVEKRQ